MSWKLQASCQTGLRCTISARWQGKVDAVVAARPQYQIEVNPQLVRVLCIIAPAGVPLALCFWFHNALAAVASGFWVLGVLAF